MKIIIALNPCKKSLSANEVAWAIEKGFREIFPGAQYVSIPVADGGERTVETMIAVTRGSEYHVWVTGPLSEKVNVSWGTSDDDKAAFIKMAAASGLELVPAKKYDPLVTTSCGAGELILQALKSGTINTIIGIGGSTTNDNDAGVVQAPGVELCDANGNEIGFGGGSLNTLNDIDTSGLDPHLRDCVTRVICDVINPLVDDNGTSHIFGPQRGTNEAMIAELDSGLSHYAEVIKKALHVDVKDVPGARVTDGMGAALMVFLGAELRSGIEIATTALNLEEHIRDCTLVTIGEGRIGSQSIHGKAPIGTANVAGKYHKPVIGIVGSLIDNVGVVHQHGIDVVFNVLTSTGTLDEAFRGAYDNICRAPRSTVVALTIGIHNAG